VLYACDYSWWKQYAAEVAATVSGERWTCSTRAKQEYDANWVQGEPHRGLSSRLGVINTGQNSGYQAIGLAHMWGASRILLLGYDFSFQGAKRHWHGDHPNNLGNCAGNFGRWIQSMNALAEDLKKEGVEVVNCSRATALKCFPRSTIDKELEGIK
jgi:hypothetical protein